MAVGARERGSSGAIQAGNDSGKVFGLESVFVFMSQESVKYDEAVASTT